MYNIAYIQIAASVRTENGSVIKIHCVLPKHGV